ncbi:MAG: hypothetical protein KZQ78_12815 [Candidatus Thiodiazotropha sp. (ex Ustalcina ferruginea)]|nr:hypothetical protein [Candidatus Thiodiazotropha sp. (ex Ustalcina ferruginea)]
MTNDECPDIRKLNVQLYKQQGGTQIPFGRFYERKVDVTLFGDGAGQNVLVEAKSKKRPVYNADYTVWNFSRGKKVGRKLIHKQFFLDRVATTEPPIENTPALASDFEKKYQDTEKIPGHPSFEINILMS